MDLIGYIAADESVSQMVEAVGKGARIVARGSQGSSTSFVAAAVARRTKRPVVLVVAHLDEADETVDELTSAGVEALRLPALEALPGESSVSAELLAERLHIVRRVLRMEEADDGMVIVCPIQALMQGVPRPEHLDEMSLVLERGANGGRGPDWVMRWLDRAGYKRVDAVEEPGEFAVRGGILDVFLQAGGDAATGGGAVRLDFFGDELDRISEIDLETMGSDRSVERVEIVKAGDAGLPSEGAVQFLELVPRRAVAMLHETLEVTEQGRGYFERLTESAGVFGPPAVLKVLHGRFSGFVEVNQFSAGRVAADVAVDLPVRALESFSRDAGEAVAEVGRMATGDHEGGGRATVVFCQNEGERQRFGELLHEFAPNASDRVESRVGYVHRGFVWGDAVNGDGTEGRAKPAGAPPVAVIPYHEILHRFETRRRLTSGVRAARAMDTFLEFEPGDFVVHRDHGIAQFMGLRLMQPRAVKRAEKVVLPGEKRKARKKKEESLEEEFLTLQFSGGALLHVPATKIDQVQKYIGGFRGKPTLSALGGTRWKKQKEQVSESVRDLAGELLRVRAAREAMPGVRYPADTAWQHEFEAEFPYEETDDQLAALAEIKKDMQRERPMDRLLCGDVGYGKTEVAIRAAFKAVEFGKQVAVLVPTTVLAEQHERTFRSRFADYPFKVASLSRFKTTQEINKTLELLRKGHVDVIIGTHRLLSKDVKFADLGLVIVDEEQRFGVEHKERLLALRMTVDVLTLSATPIPRTLHMSMLGLRDISSLATAPLDRRAVVTEVIPYNARRIQQAIQRELARDGQVFYVHNRVHNITSVADDIQRLVPEARIVIGHGQMPDKELERVMLSFVRREADILVSTTIIESGIDVPTANTMIIADADRFGLADLHQLRGRVGRYKHRAYCYMLLPENRNIQEKAVKRLKAIEEFSMLGAGFKIAMRDLEIRGAGNILGPEQSGHIAAVGYEMYCQLLDRAVREMKGERVAAASETVVEVGVTGLIPKGYIPSDLRRMAAYRRIASAATPAELDKAERDLVDAYGDPPRPVRRLLDLAEVRVASRELGVRSIAVHDRDVVFRTEDAAAVAERLQEATGTVRVLQPKEPGAPWEVYYRPPPNHLEPETLLRILRRRLASPDESAGGEAPAARAETTVR